MQAVSGEERVGANVPRFPVQIVHAEFEFPDHISEPARDLIRKMLTVDPEQRATMQDVRMHPFMNEGYSVCLLSISSEEAGGGRLGSGVLVNAAIAMINALPIFC